MKTKLFTALLCALCIGLIGCDKDNGNDEKQPISGIENGHAYVDLGLPSGLKWATCNVGASSPEGYGDYFAWGETSTKSTYDWSSYKYCKGSSTSLTKYCVTSHTSYSSGGYNGFVDDKWVLDLSDDAAHINWGGAWRMPTFEDFEELVTNCAWTYSTKGYKVIGKNGNFIFLPHAGEYTENGLSNIGRSAYWSSSLFGFPASAAWGAWGDDADRDAIGLGNHDRCRGLSVRPVLAE